jgi:hypothetical protein
VKVALWRWGCLGFAGMNLDEVLAEAEGFAQWLTATGRLALKARIDVVRIRAEGAKGGWAPAAPEAMRVLGQFVRSMDRKGIAFWFTQFEPVLRGRPDRDETGDPLLAESARVLALAMADACADKLVTASVRRVGGEPVGAHPDLSALAPLMATVPGIRPDAWDRLLAPIPPLTDISPPSAPIA